jgi:hypothetical protein
MATIDLGDQAVLFVTNVLNGTVAANGKTVFGGMVIRLNIGIPPSGLPFIQFDTLIGSGFLETLNSSALVIEPTGVGLAANGVLCVADTLENRIAGIPTRCSARAMPGPASRCRRAATSTASSAWSSRPTVTS